MPNYPISAINAVSLPQFQEWTDQYGMMSDTGVGESTGNGNLFTGHYAFGLAANGILTDAEMVRIKQVFLNNMREPGLTLRLPNATWSYNAHDDLLGIMGAEALMCPNRADRAISKSIYEYGKNIKVTGIDSNEADPAKIKDNKWAYWPLKILGLGNIKWVWNTVQPGKFHVSAWLGRRPEVIATMQMTNNKWLVNPFYWLYWAGSMMSLVWFPNKDYHDGYTLRFHSALACQGFGPITNWICKKVRGAVARDFGDFGGLMLAYFNQPNHPIVPLCKDKV